MDMSSVKCVEATLELSVAPVVTKLIVAAKGFQ
jgi:hypothetical protein